MPKDMQVLLPSGDPVWVRVTDPTGPADVGWWDERVHPLEGLVETVRAVAASVQEGLREARPNTVSVEFGITVSAKSGRVLSVLTEVGGEANLTITLGWQRADTSTGGHPDEAGDPADPRA